MDSKLKASQAEKVRRRATTQLARLGFVRGKTSFWVREAGPVIEFVHLHLFSFAPAFRVHAGIRVLNNDFTAAALNGPYSADNALPKFDETEESVTACAFNIGVFCENVIEPWFAHWHDRQALIDSNATPLNESERAGLRAALTGEANPTDEQLSRRLLGVA